MDSFGASQIIDGHGGILIPGLINTHCHVSMMPFRTLGDDCADRLRRFLFPLENDAMTRKLVRLAARYGICEMLLAGVTSFVDSTILKIRWPRPVRSLASGAGWERR